MSFVLPFVGRRKEAAQLQMLLAQRKHALILGPAGVGKTALIQHVAGGLPLLICPQSVRLTDICGALESHLGLEAGGHRLIWRKNRLLCVLGEAGKTVVFDGVAWTTPRLCSFIKCVMERVPVWIAARSEHSWDIGHVWPLLAVVERVELHLFRPAETRALMEVAVAAGRVPATALDATARLHHLSAGSPQVLCELIDGLASGHYDLHKLSDLKLLDLDRRIQMLPIALKQLHYT